jgi:tryptophan-rich hypothetical protein
VTELIKDDANKITGCILEAVINKKTYPIDWQALKEDNLWLMGWK